MKAKARWKSRRTYTLLSPTHNLEDAKAFKKAMRNNPPHLRPNPGGRLDAVLDRMKAKWTKGDDDEHGPDQCTDHTDADSTDTT